MTMFIEIFENHPYAALLLVACVFLYALFMTRRSFLARKEKAKVASKFAAEEEERRSEFIRRCEENSERANKRKDWLAKNRPRLYYNTISGITAVLRPVDFEDIKILSAKARLDERWLSKDILIFDKRSFLFFTASGKELMVRHMLRYPSFPDTTPGWLSRLHEIVEQGNVELVHEPSVFVPFVNETLLTFNKQESIIIGRGGVMEDSPNLHRMVELQAPEELWPLPHPLLG